VLDAILAAITNGPAEPFDDLARAAFAFQYERIPALRDLADRRGIAPAAIRSWRAVPMVPVAAFRRLELAAGQPVELFRSSGTSGGERSVHHHPFPGLYRAAIDASFPAFCLPHGGRPPMLALVPPRSQVTDSSLGFMVDHLLTRFGDPRSAYAFGPHGVEAAAARSWLAARQRDQAPVMLLATAFALVDLLAALARYGLRFRLAPGSTLFLTGGFKGRQREHTLAELAAGVAEALALPAEGIVEEYGMTELTSQGYTRTLLGGPPGLFVLPHWMRFRVLDPESLEELPPGEPGLLALFDLANLGSAVHLLTEDLALAEGEGFRLAGRAAGAQLRGCSLTVEELAGGA
jgi:hypothetical protein